MAPKRGKEQPPDRSPTSPPEPSCRSSSIALRDSVADARTAKMSDRIPFRKSTTDHRGGQPWPGRAWTCWSRLRNKAAGSDRDFLREAVAVLGGSRQGPGEASTSAAPRPRRRDHGTTSCRVSSRTSRQRTPRIRTRNDWAWMRSCGPTRWHALESSRVEHANDCVLASLDGRAGGRWDVARHTRTCLPEVRGGGRLHRHLGPARRSLQGR